MVPVGIGTAMGGTSIEPTPLRIPFSAIDRYGNRYEIAGEAFDTMIAIIDRLDDEYLAIESEKARERWARREAPG